MMRYSKYRNKPVYIDGIRFASKAEGRRYVELKLLQQSGKICHLILQPKFKFPMGFKYIADFHYHEKGKDIVEDVKGMETDVFKLKKKCFIYFYPKIELRIIK